VEVKVRRLPFGFDIISRILNRSKVVYIHVVRHNDNTARVLARRPFNAGTAEYEAVDLSPPLMKSVIIEITLNVTEGRFFCDRADSPCAVNIVLPKQIFRIVMRFRLIDTAEV